MGSEIQTRRESNSNGLRSARCALAFCPNKAAARAGLSLLPMFCVCVHVWRQAELHRQLVCQFRRLAKCGSGARTPVAALTSHSLFSSSFLKDGVWASLLRDVGAGARVAPVAAMRISFKG
eukprot:4822976-Pleurochrysis_carterae.AAC.2